MVDTENKEPQVEDETKEGEEEGKGTDDAGVLGRSEGQVEVSEGFYAMMAGVGASAGQIADILKNWRHLKGKGLMQVIKEFAGRKSRASAHAEVEIGKNKDFGVLHNFLEKLKSLRNDQKQDLDQKQQHDARNKPQGPGSQGPSM